jgi:hypothetical protein
MDPAFENLGPQLARWLAPFVADELRKQGFNALPRADYDDAACAEMAHELGMNSLNRAGDFFAKLAADGAVDSVTMARHLSVGTPRNISSAVTTPVKRIAKRLGLDVPWTEDENAEGRTVWRDRDGIAARMRSAIDAEREQRHLSSAAG